LGAERSAPLCSSTGAGAQLSPLAHSDRRHSRSRRALHLQRLQDEREFVNLLRGELVELHVLEQVYAVDHERDLVHGKRDLLVVIGRDPFY
jgi:hypothetical protein